MRNEPVVYTQTQWDLAYDRGRREGFEAGLIAGAMIMGLIMLALAFPH